MSFGAAPVWAADFQSALNLLIGIIIWYFCFWKSKQGRLLLVLFCNKCKIFIFLREYIDDIIATLDISDDSKNHQDLWLFLSIKLLILTIYYREYGT